MSSCNPLGDVKSVHGDTLPSVCAQDPNSGCWKESGEVLRVDDFVVPLSQDIMPEDPFSFDPRFIAGWRFLGDFAQPEGKIIVDPSGLICRGVEPGPSVTIEVADRWSFNNQVRLIC